MLGDRPLPAGIGAHASSVEIRARRGDALPGHVYAGQRPGAGSRTAAACMNTSPAAIKTDIYALFLLQSLCFIYLNTGQLEQVRKIAQVMLQGAARSEMAIMKNWADWFFGLASYQQNELEVAGQHFTQIIENRYTAQISTYRDAVAGLALIHQIQRGEF